MQPPIIGEFGVRGCARKSERGSPATKKRGRPPAVAVELARSSGLRDAERESSRNGEDANGVREACRSCLFLPHLRLAMLCRCHGEQRVGDGIS